MSDKQETQKNCYHCGGVIAVTGEELVSCLMCGRSVGHKCENCLSEQPKKTVIKSKRLIKPKRRKKAVTR